MQLQWANHLLSFLLRIKANTIIMAPKAFQDLIPLLFLLPYLLLFTSSLQLTLATLTSLLLFDHFSYFPIPWAFELALCFPWTASPIGILMSQTLNVFFANMLLVTKAN